MTVRSFPVAWRPEGARSGVGKFEIAGTTAVLDGMGDGERHRYEFDAREVENVVLSADRATPGSPGPTLHLAIRNRGWLLINGLGTGIAFEIAEIFAQLQG